MVETCWDPVNHRINHLLTGAEFLPSTVCYSNPKTIINQGLWIGGWHYWQRKYPWQGGCRKHPHGKTWTIFADVGTAFKGSYTNKAMRRTHHWDFLCLCVSKWEIVQAQKKTSCYHHGWLVVSTYPSEKWWKWKSVGIVDSIPNIWKVIKFHGSSHHQPDIWLFQLLTIINHRLRRRWMSRDISYTSWKGESCYFTCWLHRSSDKNHCSAIASVPNAPCTVYLPYEPYYQPKWLSDIKCR